MECIVAKSFSVFKMFTQEILLRKLDEVRKIDQTYCFNLRCFKTKAQHSGHYTFIQNYFFTKFAHMISSPSGDLFWLGLFV